MTARPRWPAGLAMGFIAMIAAVISYNDGLFVARLAGNHDRLAYLYPLLPDGLIVICLIALYEAARAQVPRPSWATAGLALGAGLTLAQNVGAGAVHGWLDMVLDGFVPVVFFVATEVLIWTIRRGRGALSPVVAGASPATLPAAPGTVPAAVPVAAPSVPAPDAGLDRLIVWLTTGDDPVPAAPETVPARWRLPSHRQVRQEFGCGPETAKKIRSGMVTAVKAASNGHGGTS